MKKTTITLSAIALIAFGLFQLNSPLYAKGGGGGTAGDTTCSTDTYECSDWSICNDGEQKRTCELSFDCPTTETAMPSLSQSCMAEVKEEVKKTEEPKEEEKMTEEKVKTEEKKAEETPKKTEEKKVSTPICTANDFTCSDWGICEEDGRQRRACKPSNQCVNNGKVIPPQEQVCPGLKCEHLGEIKDRIECRLKLSDAEAKKEKKILYAPEYCRIEEGAQKKAECINLYWAFEKCWAMPAGEERQACGKEESGITEFNPLVKECADKTGTSRQACEMELKEIVENWTLFTLYELEFLAESLMEKGKVNFDEVVQFDVYIEEQKSKLEEKESLSHWKNILKETKQKWTDFINQNVK